MAGLTALALAYVMSQFYRSCLAVLAPVLATELGATKGDLSAASGVWFATFALMQFAVGVWLDRYGPRRTAAWLLAFGGAGGSLLFAAATAPWMVIAAMALIGIGCAPVLMASVFIFARTQPPARLAVLVSWLVGFGSLGNIIGASPLAAAVAAFGWRAVLVGLAALSLVIALAIHRLVTDPPREAGEAAAGSGLSGYIELLRIPAMWPIIPLVMLNYTPAAGIRGLWAGPFAADVYGADAITIGHVTLAMAIGMAAGSFAYGPLDQYFRTRKWVAFAGNALSLATLLALAAYPTIGLWQATALLVAIGVFGGSYGLMVAHGQAFVPAHLTGRGVTLLNFFTLGTVGLVQFLTGPVFAAASAASPGDPAGAYRVLFLFFAGLLAVALLIYLRARDARP